MSDNQAFYSFSYTDVDGTTKSFTSDATQPIRWTEVAADFIAFLGAVYGYDLHGSITIEE